MDIAVLLDEHSSKSKKEKSLVKLDTAWTAAVCRFSEFLK